MSYIKRPDTATTATDACYATRPVRKGTFSSFSSVPAVRQELAGGGGAAGAREDVCGGQAGSVCLDRYVSALIVMALRSSLSYSFSRVKPSRS